MQMLPWTCQIFIKNVDKVLTEVKKKFNTVVSWYKPVQNIFSSQIAEYDVDMF